MIHRSTIDSTKLNCLLHRELSNLQLLPVLPLVPYPLKRRYLRKPVNWLLEQRQVEL
jgi:hypothetical protein